MNLSTQSKEHTQATWVQVLDTYMGNFYRWFLMALMMTIMFCSVLIIALRWVDVHITFLEPLVRHLVFLMAFVGGAEATRKGVHIGIDVVSKYFESTRNEQILILIKRYISMISIVALILLCKSAIDFYFVEKEFGGEGFLGLHSSTLVLIIPFGFFLIGIQFVIELLKTFSPSKNQRS